LAVKFIGVTKKGAEISIAKHHSHQNQFVLVVKPGGGQPRLLQVISDGIKNGVCHEKTACIGGVRVPVVAFKWADNETGRGAKYAEVRARHENGSRVVLCSPINERYLRRKFGGELLEQAAKARPFSTDKE
jgi:hypothetical protein